VAGALAIGDRLFAAHLGGWPPAILSLVFFGFDIPLAVLLGLAIGTLQRPNLLGAVLAAAIPLVILAASSVKFVVLGRSGLFSDAALLLDLRRTLGRQQMLLADILLAGFLLVFLANMSLVHGARRAWLRTGVGLAGFGAVLAVLPHASPLVDRGLAALPHRVSDFPFYGHVLNAMQETANERALRRIALDAPAAPLLEERLVVPLEARNLHLIVVESLIDPLWLGGFAWPQEPLSALFGRWRSEAGSTAIVPVFGNRSSDTEFEVLCGLPAAGGASGVTFMRIGSGAELACLPRLLAARGYGTISLVPSPGAFFRARNAFRAIGFASAYFDEDLDMSDLDGIWLSAEATLAQMRQAIAGARLGEPTRPVFAYAFINAGHHPYARDRARRPDRFTPEPEDAIVRDWANAAHYNALAIESHVAAIRAEDPAALIVILGDHNPPLGPNFAGYRRGGRMPPPGMRPAHSAVLHETPLLVLDRDRMVAVGRLPAWGIPDLVLDLLSAGAHCRHASCQHNEALRIRPLDGAVLGLSTARNADLVCGRQVGQPEPGEAAACAMLREKSASLAAGLLRLLAR